MAETIKLTARYEVTVGGNTYSLGSPDPVSISVAGQSFIQRVSVAQNTTVTLLDTTADLANFDFAFILSDQDVILELVTDDDASVGEEPYTIKLLANVPFVLGSNVSYANYTVNFGGGTLDVINTIRVRNLGATTANVSIHAWT